MTPAYQNADWPTPRAGEERLVCSECGSPRLVEVSTGWKGMAATFYGDDDPDNYDIGCEVSDINECWFQCGDCKATIWDDGESLVPESLWKAVS